MADKKPAPAPKPTHILTVPVIVHVGDPVLTEKVDVGAGGNPPPNPLDPPAPPVTNWFAVGVALVIGLVLGALLCFGFGHNAAVQQQSAASASPAVEVCSAEKERISSLTGEVSRLGARNLELEKSNSTLTAQLDSCKNPPKPIVITVRHPQKRMPSLPSKADFPVSKPPINDTSSTECAWIHPRVAYDQSPTALAVKRFDKPGDFNGSCLDFVNKMAKDHGFPAVRKIQ